MGLTAGALVLSAVLAIIAVMKHGVEQRATTMMKVVLIGVFILDVASFCTSLRHLFLPHTKLNPAIAQVHRPSFQVARTAMPFEDHARQVMSAIEGSFHYATVYSFAQFDTCDVKHRVDLKMKTWQKLWDADEGRTLTRISCETPKIFLSRSKGDFKVEHFDANHLAVEANALPDGEWLIYTDNFHPGWKAKVNGKDARIYEAWGVYKAVFVKGKSRVNFTFHNGLAGVLSYVFMTLGIIWGGAALVQFVFLCFGKARNEPLF